MASPDDKDTRREGKRRLKETEAARAEDEAETVASMELTASETEILAAFNNVYRRRRMERARQRDAARIAASVLSERRDEDLAKFGGVRATPETRRKLRADVVLRMFSRGDIGQPELKAAERIREARAAVAQALYPARVMEPISTKVKGVWSGRAGIERLTAHETRLWIDYIRWAVTMGDRPFDSATATRLDIVLSVIDDNRGVRQVEKSLGVRHGTVKDIVVGALVDYAIRNGLASKKKKTDP